MSGSVVAARRSISLHMPTVTQRGRVHEPDFVRQFPRQVDERALFGPALALDRSRSGPGRSWDPSQIRE